MQWQKAINIVFEKCDETLGLIVGTGGGRRIIIRQILVKFGGAMAPLGPLGPLLATALQNLAPDSTGNYLLYLMCVFVPSTSPLR